MSRKHYYGLIDLVMFHQGIFADVLDALPDVKQYLVEQSAQNPANVMPHITLDAILKLDYGLREVIPAYKNVSSEELTAIIVMNFGAYWQQLVEVTKAADTVKSKTIVETIATTGIENTDANSIEKVSGFNSAELVDDAGNSRAENVATQSDKTRTYTETYNDLEQRYDYLSLIANSGIIRTMAHDTANLLTLSVY